MIGPDDLADAEAAALEILSLAGVFPEESVRPSELCGRLDVRIEDSPGVRTAHRREADIVRIGSTWIIHKMMRMTVEREEWAYGHELGHWLDKSRGRRDRSEAYYDAVGACLVAPRPAFYEATRIVGHRVSELADAFSTLRGLALLRLGEVTGRPVLLKRGRRFEVRGECFDWGADPFALPREVAHPVKCEGAMGLMVDRGWQEAA